MFRRRAEHPLKPSSQVGSLADIRLSSWIVATKQEDRRRGGSQSEDISVACGDEIDALG